MINVSNEFNRTMSQRTDFTENAVITFVDGTVLELTEKDFTTSNNAIIDGAGSNGLPVGVAMCRSIQIELDNHDDRFSTYDFFGAKIRLYLTFKLSETTEKIEEGIFTVNAPETYGQTVIISAVDDMYKADKVYSTSLAFPATAGAVLRDVCSYCDIPLLSTSFDNDDFLIESKPDADIPCRQIIGYIAMISGGNARINRQGQLEIIHYNTTAFESTNLDGGIFRPWNEGSVADGGAFNPWDEGYVFDGGNFTDKYPYHILGYWKNVKVDTDDVVITGISIKSGENTYSSGVTGYVLSFENALITGKEQAVADYLGQKLIGLKMRKFEGDLVSNPLIEFMDPAIIIDRKGNIYQTYITDVDFNFLGLTTLKNSAENALRNSSQYYSDSIKALVEAKKLVEKEKTDREVAIANLAQQLSTSNGLYMTVESQSDGSNIYYMHDKPTLAESMIVWKLTALAFGISTDGGKTYPYGFTVDGQTITRLLYAEGINADYINTGTLSSVDGSCSINLDNGKIDIKSNGFTWESTYSSLTEEGLIQVTGGNIGGFTIGEKSLYNGKPSLDSGAPGVYIGEDGISVGYHLGKPAIVMNASGGVTVEGLSVNGAANIDGVNISNGKISMSISGSITCGLFTYAGSSIDLTNGVSISGNYIGFFGSSSWKQYVSTISAYQPTIDTAVAKINEVINALKAYGLL